MLNRIKTFLGFSTPIDRPYEDLSDEEIIQRYSEIRNRLENGGWHSVSPHMITECEHLMAEWEHRDESLEQLDANNKVE